MRKLFSTQGHTQSCIDLVRSKYREPDWSKLLLDVRVKRGAEIVSDHHLLIGEFRLKLATKGRTEYRAQRKFDTRKLRDPQVKKDAGLTLKNRFLPLAGTGEFEEELGNCKKSFIETCEHVLRYRKRERKDWIGDDTWQAIEERRDLKNECHREPEKKEQWRQEYQQKSRTAKKKTRRDKRQYVDDLACEARLAAGQRNMKDLYRIKKHWRGRTRLLADQ